MKEIMAERGLTQTAIAKMSGVSQSSISLYLSGERGLSLRTAVKISQALGVPLEDLLPEKEKKQ